MDLVIFALLFVVAKLLLGGAAMTDFSFMGLNGLTLTGTVSLLILGVSLRTGVAILAISMNVALIGRMRLPLRVRLAEKIRTRTRDLSAN